MGCLLVANRGEIAVRVLRAARELGWTTVAVYAPDDAESLHVRRADRARALDGRGAYAYLDAEQLLRIAREEGCTAVHPGYGFLSEQAAFASRCEQEGLVFVGPRPETLGLLGDKVAARSLARQAGVPVLAGTEGPTTADEARGFLERLGAGGAMMVKAVAGGGGRGMRPVTDAADVAEAVERCRSEAQAAFGNGEVYVEQLLRHARHVEVQIVGDGTGAVVHLGERDCSVQRRNQKIVEMAPASWLDAGLRARLLAAAVRLGETTRYRGVGTVEFLVDIDADPASEHAFAFIEANARLQVEHTVTEEVTGVDLVQTQLRLAEGATLASLGLGADTPVRGVAVQARVNLETYLPDGSVRPTGGVVAVFEAATGPGVRVDTFATSGYRTTASYDSLLAKVIVHHPSADPAAALARLDNALGELRVDGVTTNVGVLRALARRPELADGGVNTSFFDEHIAELVAAAAAAAPTPAGAGPALAGARIDTRDPLAVLVHGKSEGGAGAGAAPAALVAAAPVAIGPAGTDPVEAPLQGTIVSIDVVDGQAVAAGQQVAVMEAMKMEHVVTAPVAGYVRAVGVNAGDTVFPGHPLLFIEPADVDVELAADTGEVDLDRIRPDLALVVERHQKGLDEFRPDSVARRCKTGQRTARENLADIVDPGTYVEYGALAVAAQRRRRSMDDLITNTPHDGMLAGIGRVNGELFGDRAQCVVMSYDYTVLAGTQGLQNHRKKDRLFEIAERLKLPVVFFTEGGGGRPGDTDGVGGGLDCLAFAYYGKLSGLVPLVGINSGRCFAGNAALLGCCDVVIATKNSTIGMGGPAMIEGGGLGIFKPEEVGPMSVQVPNGVVDIAVEDEADAVRVAKQYLSYFQGPVSSWECADQRLLRTLIPENRLRTYDVRKVIETMADTGSMLELRREFGVGMITSFIRIEGRPLGVVANNPNHLAGAIDSDGADKAARFMQLCDAFDIPILFLCDTPGMMVGPEVEKTALVRHCSRLFVTGASLTVPFMTIVLRKGYGLGAQAMAGGSFHAPIFTVAWPTGEFGGMGLEGAVKLGYRNELAALEDPDERRELYEKMVARMYEHGKAVNTATAFEIDDVIDPLDSRHLIVTALEAAGPPPARTGKKRPNIDTW